MTITNNPQQAGQVAGRKEFFGEPGESRNRYAIYPVHTRFDAVQWFVADAEVIDELTGFASVIRQAPTKAAAMAGLSSFPVPAA